MPAHPWELRADVRQLDLAAQRWDEVGALLARRGDELVAVARRATDGWDASAAESYESHRRLILAHLDRFTNLAGEIAGSLRAVSSVLTSSQKELERAWVNVALVPHDVVGESGHLVFHPSQDDDRGKLTRGQAEAEEIRRRLTLALDQESTRLRSSRAEFASVRSELTALAGGAFPGGLPSGAVSVGGSEGVSGVGTVAPSSTSVLGSAQSGIAALAPIASISVSLPDLTAISSAAVAPLAATAASGLAAGRGTRRTTDAVPPVGGMGGGAMGVRAGTMRSMAGGRSGPHRLAAPKLSADDEDGRMARDKEAARQAEKEAKRAALAEKRAERAARRAERESEHDDRDLRVEIVGIELDDEPDDEPDDELDEQPDGETDADGRALRR